MVPNVSPFRYSRIADIIPADKVKMLDCTIIGVGAIGRQVALQLASIGVEKFRLIDFDLVDESNISTQGYYEQDLDRDKVDALADNLRLINAAAEVDAVCDKYVKGFPVSSVVFSCVDNIETRQELFRGLRGNAELYIDGRMGAQVCRVLSCYDKASWKHYQSTLFPASEAFREPCTAKSTIFCANIAAGFMVSQYAQWLKDCIFEKDFTVNIFTKELMNG